MKSKFYLIAFAIIAVLLISAAVAATMLIPANEKAKENSKAAENSPVIGEDFGLNANGLERIEFIHYKKGFANPNAAKAPKATSCYKFLTGSKPRLINTASYVINPANPQYLDANFVTSAISTAAETWDAATSKELFNDAYTIDYEATYGVQNYQNAITFGNYAQRGVIAVTSIWWNPSTKAIVEFDILFDTDFAWGNAEIDSTVMDLQNIATHELGHGAGLGDVYDSACSEVTMYGYSNYGEIQKRTLEPPDITGLQKLYGA